MYNIVWKCNVRLWSTNDCKAHGYTQYIYQYILSWKNPVLNMQVSQIKVLSVHMWLTRKSFSLQDLLVPLWYRIWSVSHCLFFFPQTYTDLSHESLPRSKKRTKLEQRIPISPSLHGLLSQLKLFCIMGIHTQALLAPFRKRGRHFLETYRVKYCILKKKKWAKGLTNFQSQIQFLVH